MVAVKNGQSIHEAASEFLAKKRIAVTRGLQEPWSARQQRGLRASAAARI